VAKRETTESTIGLLAQSISSADAGTVSPAAIEQAKLLLLDTIGCGFAGRREPAARAVLNTISKSRGPCPVIGQSVQTSMLDAVLANGTLVRVLDLNDYIVAEGNGEPESGGHPSDNIPVALAAGPARKRSGRDILATIVLGYEFYARLHHAIDRAGPWDGVTVSGLVAPAIAGRLMGLSEPQLAHALALGAARAATPSIVRSGNISAAKSLANALVAQSGAQAALLAEQGATGPLAVLDDRRGLRDLFVRLDASALCAPFLSDGAIMRAHVKSYPCINTGQSAVAAALRLHAMINGKTSPLSRIEVTMADYKVTKRHQDDPERRRPVSREAADHSFPFVVAVALIDGRFGPEQFEHERWRDERVTALMERIVMRRDTVWNSRAPGSYPCSIRAISDDGTEHHVEVAYPPGYSQDGLDANIVLDKFHGVTESILDRADRARIVDTIMEFDRHASADDLSAAIAIEGKSK
jgi:2-methylcitrate dehydratase